MFFFVYIRDDASERDITHTHTRISPSLLKKSLNGRRQTQFWRKTLFLHSLSRASLASDIFMYIINFYNYIVLIFVQNHKSRENIFLTFRSSQSSSQPRSDIYTYKYICVFKGGQRGWVGGGGEAINNHVERSPAVKCQNCARSRRARWPIPNFSVCNYCFRWRNWAKFCAKTKKRFGTRAHKTASFALFYTRTHERYKFSLRHVHPVSVFSNNQHIAQIFLVFTVLNFILISSSQSCSIFIFALNYFFFKYVNTFLFLLHFFSCKYLIATRVKHHFWIICCLCLCVWESERV